MKASFIFRFAAIIAVILSFTVFTSCQSKEERVISKLESLCKTVESDSFSMDDLETVKAKFEQLHQETRECNFTNEQVKEVAKLEARFTKALATKAIEHAGNVMGGALEGLTGKKKE